MKFDDVISDEVWWCNIKILQIWVISKITSANLCRPIHDIINYSTSICPFVSGKCGNYIYFCRYLCFKMECKLIKDMQKQVEK